MDNLNNILTIINTQQLAFAENLQKIRQRPGKKAVHDWRVAVKHIRSYLRLKNAITNEPWKEGFAETKMLFGIMGKYRDVEMSQALLAKFQKTNTTRFHQFKTQLSGSLTLTRKNLNQAVSQYHETGLLELVNKMQISFQQLTEPEDKIKKAVKENIRKVVTAMEHFKKNAHEIRKLLKDIYYWLKLLPIGCFFANKQMKLLDTILNKLGQWQDYFVFHRKLESFRNEILAKPDVIYSHYKTFENEIEDLMENLLTEAEKETKKLVNDLK